MKELPLIRLRPSNEFELPAEVSALISERLWTGGSLIITDESLSDETSDVGTDLVVTVR